MQKNNVIIQVGYRATGKTEFCKRIIKHQLRTMVDYGKSNRCLVIDVNNEYQDIRSIDTFDDSFFQDENKEGVYRINFANFPKEERKNVYIEALRNFTNGLLICEDPSIYFLNGTGKLDYDFVGMIVTSETHKRTVIANFQLWRNIFNPLLISNIDIVILRRENITSLSSFKHLLPSPFYNLILDYRERLNTLPLEYFVINMEEVMSDFVPCKENKESKDMKKYTKTYLIQLMCLCIFMAMSLTGLYNYDPNNQMMFSIVGGVGILIALAFTLNFLNIRKKNRD